MRVWELVQNRLVDNLKKVTLVRQDHLYNTEILTEFEQEVLRRTTAFLMPQPTFLMQYHTFPTKPFAPNVGVDFKGGFAPKNLARVPLQEYLPAAHRPGLVRWQRRA